MILFTQPAKQDNHRQGLGIGNGLRYIGHMGRALLLIVGVCLASSPAITHAADDDHLRARELLQAGAILPLEQILERAKLEHPGRILEVKFEQERSRYVYEIELVDEEGRVWEVEYDAATGDLVEKEQEE